MSRSSLSLFGFFFSVSHRRRRFHVGQLLRRESTSTWLPPQLQNPSPRVLAIVDELAGLSLLELADLTETLRIRLRVDQMPGVAVMTPGMPIGGLAGGKAGASGAAADGKEEKVEKSSFDLKLDSFDAAAKIKIIKEVRSFTDLGLKEAKDLVEKAPAVIKKGVPKEEAEKIVQKMKEVGAKVIME